MGKLDRFCAGLLALLLLAVFSGCGQREQIRTVVLPPLETQMLDADKLRINHIQTYVGAGESEDSVYVAWGEPGEDLLYQLEYRDGGYLYQTIDTRTDGVRNAVEVEDRIMLQIRIAPGGQYLSYEAWEEETAELIVFCPRQGSRKILHMWNSNEEGFDYVWSADGTKLFTWQYTVGESAYRDWQVTRYGIESGPDGSLQVEKAQFQMEGHGDGDRVILPNADGSQVYVREQFYTYDDSGAEEKKRINGQSDRTENINQDIDRYVTYVTGASAAAEIGFDVLYMAQGKEGSPWSNANINDGDEYETVDTCNWLLLPDEARKLELEEYSPGAVFPLRLTPAGLFFQDKDGTLCLVEDLEHPMVKELLSVSMEPMSPVLCICENGDHIFLTECINNTIYEVSGVQLVDGKLNGDPVVLYRDNYENLDSIETLFDRALVLWGGGFWDKNWYNYKITTLEY